MHAFAELLVCSTADFFIYLFFLMGRSWCPKTCQAAGTAHVAAVCTAQDWSLAGQSHSRAAHSACSCCYYCSPRRPPGWLAPLPLSDLEHFSTHQSMCAAAYPGPTSSSTNMLMLFAPRETHVPTCGDTPCDDSNKASEQL